MVFTIIYFLIAIAASGSIYYFLGLYHEWWWFWVPVIGIPVFYVCAFGLTLVFCFIVSKMININKEQKKPNRFFHFVTMEVNRQLLFFLGVRVKKTGMHGISKKGPYMIVYNHISNFDPMVIMAKFKRVICVTKPENKKAPIAGPFIHKSGFISINREDDKEGIKAIMTAIDYIEKGYGQICIAPEGTRSKTLELLPFHPGAFNIAKRAEVPILCIGIKNTNLIHKNVLKRTTKVHMDVLALIEPSEFMELSTLEISNKVHKIYEDYLGENK